MRMIRGVAGICSEANDEGFTGGLNFELILTDIAIADAGTCNIS